MDPSKNYILFNTTTTPQQPCLRIEEGQLVIYDEVFHTIFTEQGIRIPSNQSHDYGNVKQLFYGSEGQETLFIKALLDLYAKNINQKEFAWECTNSEK